MMIGRLTSNDIVLYWGIAEMLWYCKVVVELMGSFSANAVKGGFAVPVVTEEPPAAAVDICGGKHRMKLRYETRGYLA